MKTRDIAKVLRSKISSQEKKRILENEISKPSTGKVVAGAVVATVVATGIAKVIIDKIKERKILKEIEEQEEIEFWEEYYNRYEDESLDIIEYDTKNDSENKNSDEDFTSIIEK